MNKYKIITSLIASLLIIGCDLINNQNDESDMFLEIEKIDSTREYDSENDVFIYTKVDTTDFMFDNIDLSSMNYSNASEIQINNPSSSYNVFVETNFWVSRDLKVFLILKDHEEGFTDVLALGRNQGTAIFSSGNNNTFDGTLYGFFIEDLSEEENITDNNFYVNISSGDYEEVLVVNPIENMINPEYSFTYMFDESDNDEFFFDFNYVVNLAEDSNDNAIVIFENYNDSIGRFITTLLINDSMGGSIAGSFKTTSVYILGLSGE